ncbi:peptide synthetase [Mycobacterium colombiense]|uniref:Peptide synthetase n=1 Tax=Mycobacterium colombiense TaxID=339268 RepID=A0A329KJS5_9MYCO|nr:condensation domain-containing protein [Mycobacterium colombiense]RAU92286.1 peptide synthetase [Mycobacterium colombiense]
MIVNNPQQGRATTLVRPLGAAERLFYRYSERNPAHFSIVAEFHEVLAEKQLRAALAAVQRRHPQLSVHVEDREGTRLGFYRATDVGPVELTVRRGPELAWQAAAAEELTRPFDRSRAPLMRAVLLQSPSRSALLLTFDHTVADGISSTVVLRDVIAALNGEALTSLPVPQPQEHVVAEAFESVEPLASAAPDDPRMSTPSIIRPFDGTLTNVRAMEMTHADTARLVARCRAERTTVHAALVVAKCRVRATDRGEGFIRVLSPINLRSILGIDGGCVMCIVPTATGHTPWDGTPFWEQARAMTAHLEVARSPSGIRTASVALEQMITVDAETADAEQLFSRISPWDIMVTNLGVQNLNGASPLRPTAVWGPVVVSQTDGEYLTGVTTYEGRLRMVTCGYSVPASFLKGVGDALMAALEDY